jgi:hypothetical protein
VQYLAELLRLKAELLAACGDMALPKRFLIDAIEIASAQRALGLVRRAQATRASLTADRVTHTEDLYEYR